MATNHSPQNHAINQEHEEEEEDYIDMELTSSSPSSSSPQNSSREFEFQLTSHPLADKETTAAAADELFFKGKLLPLHTTKNPFQENHHFYYSSSKTPLIFPIMACSTAPCTNAANTPSESCNISPSESCRASCELNPDEYFFQWSTELSSFNNHFHHHPMKKHWYYSKKVKLSQKLKASRTYLKSLFTKSACSDESSAKANTNAEVAENSNKYFKINNAKNKKQKLFEDDNMDGRGSYIPTVAAIMKNSVDREHGLIEDNNVHRRSFSGALKRHSPTKCLSSSSSNSSSSSSSSSNISLNSIKGFHEMRFLRRSSSVTEIEGSIEAAIAHCKMSQLQILDSRNSSKDIGV